MFYLELIQVLRRSRQNRICAISLQGLFSKLLLAIERYQSAHF